jgi:hypothetical protein
MLDRNAMLDLSGVPGGTLAKNKAEQERSYLAANADAAGNG